MGSAAENFDAWFKERLETYEETPRAAAWDNIAEKLGHKQKKRILIFIMRIAAGMLLMLSLGLGYYYFTRQDRTVQPTITEKQQQQDQPSGIQPETPAGKENAVTPGSHTPASRVADEQGAVSGMTAANSRLTTGSATAVMIAAEAQEQHSRLPSFDNVPLRIRPVSAILQSEIAMSDMVVHLKNRTSVPESETNQIIQQNLAMMEDEGEAQQDYKNWMVGGQVAPLYSYRNLNTVNADIISNDDIKALNHTEKGIIAYAGGIAMAFSPSRRLSVQSGIYYSKYGQEKTDIENVAYNRNEDINEAYQSPSNVQVTISNSTGVITNEVYMDEKMNQPNTMTQKGLKQWGVVYYADVTPGIADNTTLEAKDLTAFQYFEYLEVPLMVRYKLIDRKMDFSLLGGISTNFLAGNSVKISDNNNLYDFGETTDIAKVNYSGSVGVGIEYPILTNLLVSLEPKFRYYLNPIYTSGDLNVFPYSLGVFAGLSYLF